ncbi:MAG TPA: carbohydrate-binding family 9-like protein [Feifaniaceae bacterium]|nr:carbohydrate-binding family 9-like protein [Feifaniaceae bacterium]
MIFYGVRTIPKKENIGICPLFHVDNVQWNSKKAPPTVGRMGYVPGEGLFVFMKCYEKDPRRTMTQNMDRVCLDSAMEAFFAFPDRPVAEEEAFTPDDNGMYCNFELNANGAMYAKTGRGRQGRLPLTQGEFAAADARAAICADSWEITFLVPNALLSRVAGKDGFLAGDVFFCNFYKISETPEIEHYLSFSPIETESPNFHLPRFFAKAVIQE